MAADFCADYDDPSVTGLVSYNGRLQHFSSVCFRLHLAATITVTVLLKVYNCEDSE